MNISERLKQWRTTKKLLQKDVADLLGMSVGVYQKYEMGVSAPGAGAMEAFVRAGINTNWLLTGEGQMLLESMGAPTQTVNDHSAKYMYNGAGNEFALIPFYDVEASAGHGVLVDQELQISQMAFRKDWLKFKGLQPSKCALIKAKGDSMEPTIYDGDLLLIDTSINTIKDDSIYIVQTDNHLIVKRIQQDWDGSLIVISDNPRYEKRIISPEQAKEVKIAGRVRWYGHEI